MTVSELRTLVDNLDEYIHIPGGIDRLKKMVLHLAVSGQLVPQDSTEGTGEELCQQIQSEKSDLVKQGRIKKQKPLPEISENEEPFSIPESWKWVRLGDILKYLTDGSHFSPPATSEGLPYVNVKDVSWSGEIDLKNSKKISQKSYKQLVDNDCQPSVGDVLFSKDGTVGKCAVVYEGGFVVLSSLAILKNMPEFIVPEYLRTSLISPSIQDQALASKTGSALRRIILAKLQSIIVPIPHIAEQKRIVAKVDSIFALIDQLSAAYKAEQAERTKLVASSLAQLAKGEDGVGSSLALTHLSEIIHTKADAKVLRQTILHLAVSGQLVPQDPSEGTGEALYRQIKAQRAELIKQGKTKVQKQQQSIGEDEILFKIPDSWKWVRLIEVSDRLSAGGDKPKDFSKSKSDTNTIPVIANGETNKGIIGYTSEARICVPSVTVSGRGTIGYSEVRNYPYTPIVRLIVVEPCSNVDLRYLKFVFTSILEVGQGTSIPQLTVPMVSPKPVPLPPYAEQKRIVAKTTQLLDFVSELEKHLEK